MIQSFTTHYSNDRFRDIHVPFLDWDQTLVQFRRVLSFHEEEPAEGSRFLVQRIHHSAYRSENVETVNIEYLFTRTGTSWTRHIVVWDQECPYPYDYDVTILM